LAYGADNTVLKDNRVASSQCLSGTGGLRVAFEFMKHFGPNKENTVVHLPKPTWGNHNQIIKYAGLQANVYK